MNKNFSIIKKILMGVMIFLCSVFVFSKEVKADPKCTFKNSDGKVKIDCTKNFRNFQKSPNGYYGKIVCKDKAYNEISKYFGAGSIVGGEKLKKDPKMYTSIKLERQISGMDLPDGTYTCHLEMYVGFFGWDQIGDLSIKIVSGSGVTKTKCSDVYKKTGYPTVKDCEALTEDGYKCHQDGYVPGASGRINCVKSTVKAGSSGSSSGSPSGSSSGSPSGSSSGNPSGSSNGSIGLCVGEPEDLCKSHSNCEWKYGKCFLKIDSSGNPSGNSNSSNIGNTCGETNYGKWTADSCYEEHVEGKCHLWDSSKNCCNIFDLKNQLSFFHIYNDI